MWLHLSTASKMKKTYYHFLVCLFIVSCKGQGRTKTAGVADTDPASDIVSAALEDKNGNIWFGTRNAGVDRYDGKVITNFSKKDGIGNNDVSCIFEDKNELIWFGSNFAGVGLSTNDGKSFTNIRAKEIVADKEGWQYAVMTITQDNEGDLWFGSRGGHLFRYDGQSFTDFSEKDG